MTLTLILPNRRQKACFTYFKKGKLFTPDYGRVTQVLNGIGCSPSLMPMVGFKLLGLRCIKDQNNQNRNADDSVNDEKE